MRLLGARLWRASRVRLFLVRLFAALHQHTYGAPIMISALEKGSHLGHALEAFREMQQQGIVPNVITYSALISACEKAKQPERALKIFDTMQQ